MVTELVIRTIPFFLFFIVNQLKDLHKNKDYLFWYKILLTIITKSIIKWGKNRMKIEGETEKKFFF